MALFCTDTILDAHGDAIAAAAPGLDVVALRAGEPVTRDDVERLTVAFFSSDAWPERASAFMRVALDAPNLRWLHSMSAGVDSPVFSMFLDRGVRVTTSSGASSAPIAATVMMYLLALSRGLPRLFRAQQRHEWEPRSFDELAGRRLTVLGYGPIGQEVVRLGLAFGMTPTIVRRRAIGDEPCAVRSLSEIVDVATTSDSLVVALPLTDETRRLVSREVIDALPAGALFVNVGRGELVDQDALTDALTDGRLGGAGLDVFDPEPLPAESPLWDLPNVIVTPHSSGSSTGTGGRVVDIFLDNLARFHSGRPLVNEMVPAS